jgi:O-antigen ligase
LFLLLSLVVLARSRWSSHATPASVFWFAWWLFWILYLMRLMYDGAMQPSALKLPLSEYISFALGASLLPALAMAGRHALDMAERLFVPLLVACVIGLLLNLWAIFFHQGLLAQLQLSELRAESETLNPITIGHLGATVVLLAVWQLLEPAQTRARKRILLPVLLILIGLASLAASGSRGPVLALLFALLAAFAVLGRRSLRLLLALIAIALLVGLLASKGGLDLELESLFLFERLSGAAFVDEERAQLLAEGWQAFQTHPLTGAGTEPLATYPHNIVLESFMAVGIVGGIAFSTVFVLALIHAVKLVRAHPRLSWLSLLLLQYAVGAMFSGSLSQSTALWLLMTLVVGAASSQRPQPR